MYTYCTLIWNHTLLRPSLRLLASSEEALLSPNGRPNSKFKTWIEVGSCGGRIYSQVDLGTVEVQRVHEEVVNLAPKVLYKAPKRRLSQVPFVHLKQRRYNTHPLNETDYCQAFMMVLLQFRGQ